jgi:hypothetical protein
MYKPSIYVLRVVSNLPIFLPIQLYMRPISFTELVTKVKPNTNSVEVHPQLSNNRHPVDGGLVGAG